MDLPLRRNIDINSFFIDRRCERYWRASQTFLEPLRVTQSIGETGVIGRIPVISLAHLLSRWQG